MAAKVAIITCTQKTSDIPVRYVSKNRASRFVRSGHYRALTPALIQEIDPAYLQRLAHPVLSKRTSWDQGLILSYPIADQRTTGVYQ